MRQEEKARAYDEALERARELYKDAVTLQLEQDIKVYETIFPELKESEWERTRKQILNYFMAQKVNEPQPVLDSWIAWLEKQGEPIDANVITRDDEILQAISVGLTDVAKDAGWSDFGGIPIEEIQSWLEKEDKQ